MENKRKSRIYLFQDPTFVPSQKQSGNKCNGVLYWNYTRYKLVACKLKEHFYQIFEGLFNNKKNSRGKKGSVMRVCFDVLTKVKKVFIDGK